MLKQMENEKFKNLSELVGKHAKVKESAKSTEKKKEKFFLELMENMCQIEAVNAVLGTIGIHVENMITHMYVQCG
jgi:flagellar hook assembly protein FlgD